MMLGASDTMLHFFVAATILLQVTYSSYTCGGCESKRSGPDCNPVLSNSIQDYLYSCKKTTDTIEPANKKIYEEYPSFECTPAPKISSPISPECPQDILRENIERPLDQCQQSLNIGAQESFPLTYCSPNPTPVPSVDEEQTADPPESDPSPNQEESNSSEASLKEMKDEIVSMKSSSMDGESPGSLDITRAFQQCDAAPCPTILKLGPMEDRVTPQLSMKMEPLSVQSGNTELNSSPLEFVNECTKCSPPAPTVTLGDAPPLSPIAKQSDSQSETSPVDPIPLDTIEKLSTTKPTKKDSKSWIMSTDLLGSGSQSSISTILPMSVGSMMSNHMGMVECMDKSLSPLTPTSRSCREMDSLIEETPQPNPNPQPLEMDGMNLGAICSDTMSSDEPTPLNPTPEIQCRLDQTSSKPFPGATMVTNTGQPDSAPIPMECETQINSPLTILPSPPSCQLISVPSLGVSPQLPPCSSNILPPIMYDPLPCKESSTPVGCTLNAETSKIDHFSCTPVSATYSGCKNIPIYSVCSQPSTCTSSTIRPVYEEIVHHVPVLKKVIRNRMVETTRHVPIVEKHIIHEKTQTIRHVPVIKKIRRNVIEYNTKHIPVIRHRTRTVQDSYTEHVPHVQKFTRPVVETIIKQVPVVYRCYKPVLNTRVRHVPIVETKFTPVVDETITTVPVRRRVIKNIVEEKIKPVFRPCPKNLPESSSTTFYPENNWCCW